jgi:hypothetical protein
MIQHANKSYEIEETINGDHDQKGLVPRFGDESTQRITCCHRASLNL